MHVARTCLRVFVYGGDGFFFVRCYRMFRSMFIIDCEVFSILFFLFRFSFDCAYIEYIWVVFNGDRVNVFFFFIMSSYNVQGKSKEIFFSVFVYVCALKVVNNDVDKTSDIVYWVGCKKSYETFRCSVHESIVVHHVKNKFTTINDQDHLCTKWDCFDKDWSEFAVTVSKTANHGYKHNEKDKNRRENTFLLEINLFENNTARTDVRLRKVILTIPAFGTVEWQKTKIFNKQKTIQTKYNLYKNQIQWNIKLYDDFSNVKLLLDLSLLLCFNDPW